MNPLFIVIFLLLFCIFAVLGFIKRKQKKTSENIMSFVLYMFALFFFIVMVKDLDVPRFSIYIVEQVTPIFRAVFEQYS